MAENKYEYYCNYLQEKYGVPDKPYFTETSYYGFLVNGTHKSLTKNKITRTADGLYVHHKREDKAIMLSDKNFLRVLTKAKGADAIPFEWQQPKNLVYCNLLEHLELHVLIAEMNDDKTMLGIGGVSNFILPELVWWIVCGQKPKAGWAEACYNAVSVEAADKKMLELAKRLYPKYKNHMINGAIDYIERCATYGDEPSVEIVEKFMHFYDSLQGGG